MDKRPETRVATVILVRAWGMDADGRPFFQNANATNLSSEGARILGISHPLKSGDVIGVQYEDKKARFKVIWVIDSGVARQIEAGVQVLPNQSVPWQALTKNDKVAIAPGRTRGNMSGTRFCSLWRLALRIPDVLTCRPTQLTLGDAVVM